MTINLSQIDNNSTTNSRSRFATTISDAITHNSKHERKSASSLVVVTENSRDQTSNGNIQTLRIEPDAQNSTGSASPTVSISQDTQTFATTPNTALETTREVTTAVILTTDSEGQVNNAAAITITENADGSGPTLSIEIADDTQIDGVSTITIDSDTLPDDARIAFGVISNDPSTGEPQNLVLIIPSETSGDSTSTFVLASISQAETIDPSSAFRNYGFTTLSGRGLGSSFGGAVSIDVNGKPVVVWLDAGQNVAANFTGEINASFGTMAPDSEGSSSTVAGIVGNVTLKFENGVLSEISQGDKIDNFDSFVRGVIDATPPMPTISSDVARGRQSVITTQGAVFAARYTDQTDAIIRSLGTSDLIDRRILINQLQIDTAQPRSGV